MSSPLLKIAGLSAAALAHYVSTTPPVPPPGPQEKVDKSQFFEHVVLILSKTSKTLVALTTMCEATLIAVLAYPSAAARAPEAYGTLCPRPVGNMATIASAVNHIPLVFYIGIILCILGGMIRVWTYRVLGRLFTYEVTIRADHKLVTAGPYGIVRHPSYSALFANMLGTLCMLYSQKEWNGVCGIFDSMFGRAVTVWPIFWLSLAIFTARSVWKRGAVEDELMKSEFSGAWVKYHQEVPHKFFPGLI